MIRTIIGSSELFPIEHRFLNGACAISLFFSVAIVINNIALELDPVLNLIIGLSSVVFGVLYYFARIRRYYLVPLWGLIILFIIDVPPAWFLNSGLFGSTLYICILILTLLIVIVRGRSRAIIAVLFIAELLAMIAVEYWYPDLVVPYKSRGMQFVDIFGNLAFALVMLVLLIMLVMKNYEEEKKKADESNRLKSFFLANISHEIRTPMNSILGFSELLHDSALPDEEKLHYIRIIHKSGHHLMGLIDDIIDLSRIEAGEIVMHPKPFPIDALMGDLYDIFTMQLKTGVVRLVMELPAGVRPGSIVADEMRLRQVLMNLIGNAVKFTESGSIWFGYRIAGPDRLLFHVADTGIGIAPEHLKDIFLQFRQADDSYTRKYGGAGLGLSISQKLVNLMGGEIRVESEPGRGTIFTFDIPYQPATESAGPRPGQERSGEESGSRDRWKGKTVLVVEDDDDSYRFLERVMARYGINVMRSSNGLDAVETCRNDAAIDCVLMDIQLPFISGTEAAKKIREIRKDLPIIAQSGNVYDADRAACLEAGCNEFIAKPILPDALLAVLDRFL